MNLNFYENKEAISGQFEAPRWALESGLPLQELWALAEKIESDTPSPAIAKAKIFELLLTRARIASDTADIFQDKLLSGAILADIRAKREERVRRTHLSIETEECRIAWGEFGAYEAKMDFGHTSPNSRLLLSVGFQGLLSRICENATKSGLTERQTEFYESCRIVLEAMIAVCKRHSEAIRPYNEENATALWNIALGAPQNIYEAMQLLVLYFFMHEYVGATRVRTLGRLDVLLYPFYQKDLESGRYTKEEIREMLRFFLHKLWIAKVPYDLPFCLGGTDEKGEEVTSEFTHMIVEVYDELDIYSPKIHIRVSEKTPKSLLKLVLSCIRRGHSSFVFINDKIAIESLMRIGIPACDARNFVPIGCYEPAVWGEEIGCTDNSGVNLAKAVEFVFNDGRDQKSGTPCGTRSGKIDSFEDFVNEVKKQIAHMTHRAVHLVKLGEKYYGEINPDPLLSCQYDESVRRGVDVYDGGAKYNNSSLYFYAIGTLVDSLSAIKRLVFDEGAFTLDALGEMLRSNWEGYESERRRALRLKEKWGNNDPTANMLAKEFATFCASLVNNQKNSRGGVFKAALFSINRYISLGKHTAATPDGRRYGDPLSKNMDATIGMDRGGVTALIHSATAIDHADFPTGSVLDIMLHPSAVAGEEGLSAFLGILTTYFQKGGYALQGNVFLSNELRRAQETPEKYRHLQVRVCGWNAYFINLSREEQDAFIRQAEALI